MFLVFTVTFIIIISTSIAQGPFAVNAASSSTHQQKQHKSTLASLDSANGHNDNVPERSTRSGVTRPGKNYGKRQYFNISRI